MIRSIRIPFNIFFYFTILILTGCYSLIRLPNNDIITNDPKAYKNISKFSDTLKTLIDTSALYKECCSLFTLESSLFGFDKVSKHEYYNRTDGYVNYYRFYGNGHCNNFMLKTNQQDLQSKTLTPLEQDREVFIT